jgi:hypothetical protein
LAENSIEGSMGMVIYLRPCPSPSLSPPSPPLSALAIINKIDNSNNYIENYSEHRNRARYPTACRSYPAAKL